MSLIDAWWIERVPAQWVGGNRLESCQGLLLIIFIITLPIRKTYRGYYMPLRRYEFYLWVFNSISLEQNKIILIHIQKRACNIVYYMNTSEKGAIYYVTIMTVISSHVKITCYFHVSRYEVFAWKLTYFTGIYIYIIKMKQQTHEKLKDNLVLSTELTM